MKHLLKSLFVLAAFPLMSLVPAFAAYNIQDYYPLSQGNSWTYFNYQMELPEIYAFTQTEIVSGTDNVEGISTIRLVEEEKCYPQGYNYQNIAWNEEGLKLYYEHESEDGGTQPWIEEGSFLTPELLLPAQMEIGHKVTHNFAVEWHENSEYGEYGEYEEGTITCTLEKIETITVEAGTFQDCLKIHRESSAIVYDSKGGTQRDYYWAKNGYVWLAHDIGPIKEILTETSYYGDYEELDTETKELRWATINNVDIGTGVKLWYGIDFSNAEASFNETTMYLHCVCVDDAVYNGLLAFRLDLEDNIFYAFEPAGCGPVSVSGLDFTNAYIKMNGDSLTIYDIDISGAKYWTQWRLVIEPSVGFLFVDYGLMQ